MADDCGALDRRLIEDGVGRGVVDDQNAVYRAGLPPHHGEGALNDIGIVEGVDVSENAHRS